MTMTRYVLIDNCSGYVWGVVNASSPIDAVEAVDQEIDGDPRVYEEVLRPNFSNETGYHVHIAPPGFTVDDGQDEDQIAAASALPLACFVRISPRDDL